MKLKWLRYFVVALVIVLSICMNSTVFAEECPHMFHDHVCTECGWMEPGLYYEGEYKRSWSALIDNGFIVEILRDGERSIQSSAETLKGHLVIDEGVVNILYGAFGGSQIEEVTLPATVRYIGPFAFRGSKLVNAHLNDGLEKIDTEAFGRCENLLSIEIPVTMLKSLGDHTFAKCTSLYSVTTRGAIEANNYVEVEEGIFRDCSALKTVDLSAFNIVSNRMFMNCVALEELVFPSNIEYIGEDAFVKCEGLKTISFESDDVYFVRRCFQDCIGLEKAELPDNTETLPALMFGGCASLREVYVGANTKRIDYSVFGMGLNAVQTSSLIKLYIPKTLIFIEDYAFRNAQLNDDLVIYYEGDDFDWMLVEKPEILESVDVVFECDYYNREDKNQ